MKRFVAIVHQAGAQLAISRLSNLRHGGYRRDGTGDTSLHQCQDSWEVFIMFDLINPIDTALRPIEGLHHLSLLARPHLKTVWQVVTAEKTQRVLRASSLAILMSGAILLCGMFEVGRLAIREATITFQTELAMTIAKSDAAETIENSEPEAEPLISRKTGVRLLRQVATQRGIRNTGRMRKSELLALLELG
jgi:hypothetical protein